MEVKNKSYSKVKGFNYQPSYGSCGFEIWYNFNPRKIKEEISIGKKYFPEINTLRIWLSWDAYLKDRKKFKNNFDIILNIMEEFNLKGIPVLFNAWQGFPYFGGVSYSHILNYRFNPSYHRDYFISYVEDIVGTHCDDRRILTWDLCNEPSAICQTEENRKIVFEWLCDIYNFCKKEIKVKSPLCVSVVSLIEEIKLYEPILDIITPHPYWASTGWGRDKDKFKKFLDDVVKIANSKGKGVIATETGWGNLDDKVRVETLEFELSELTKRKIGFLVHLLWHTFVADGHRPEYGPVSTPGYMAFIEIDGSLREGHEIFNKFCSKKAEIKGKINFLEEYTKEVIEKCKVFRDIEGKLYKFYIPSGDMKYPSFFPRDFLYMVESGLIKSEEIKQLVEFIAERQNEKERKLKYGLIIPKGAIPDHINFDGDSVFFPGTYSSSDEQGKGKYGFYPSHDNQYFFIEIVNKYIEKTGDYEFLGKKIKRKTLFERLEIAFKSYNIDEKTQLCFSDEEKYTVDWGFCDSIKKTGLLLFPSISRYNSALIMEKFSRKVKKSKGKYRKIAEEIKNNILKYFWDGSGYLLSATGICRQHDVVGTIFAVYSGILEREYLKKALMKIKEGYLKNKCVDEDSYVRYIPEGEDFSENSCWEAGLTPKGIYQNGGYWSFATGWYIYSLSKIDMKLAKEMAEKFLNHVLKMRKKGAPYEWKNKEGNFSGCFYGPSITLPFKFISYIL